MTKPLNSTNQFENQKAPIGAFFIACRQGDIESTFEQLKHEKGIPLGDRQLRRLEAKGAFPKRIPIASGCAIKGWPEIIIDEHLAQLAEKSRAAR
jgi:predicted DNA-binding transcriptional regulator AlpA